VIGTILEALFYLLVPTAALWLEKRVRVVSVMGSVALCYIIGFAIANTPSVSVDTQLALTLSTASVALAIPLLLFSLDFRGWLKQAPQTLLAFLWVVVAVCVATAIARPIFADRVADSAKVAGMLVGVYTGGTPNLAASATKRSSRSMRPTSWCLPRTSSFSSRLDHACLGGY